MVLRVKLEIVPYGDETRAREIGRLDIFNKGHVENTDVCQYGVIDLTKDQEGMFDGKIYHVRSAGAWQLVITAIASLMIQMNPESPGKFINRRMKELDQKEE